MKVVSTMLHGANIVVGNIPDYILVVLTPHAKIDPIEEPFLPLSIVIQCPFSVPSTADLSGCIGRSLHPLPSSVKVIPTESDSLLANTDA
jgi:hypothetical protein